MNENTFLKDQVLHLQEQLSWLQRQIFGKKSEKIVSSSNEEQLSFEGFESLEEEKKKKQ